MFIVGHKPRLYLSIYLSRFVGLQHPGKQGPHDVSTLNGLLVAVIITRDKRWHGIGWKPTETLYETSKPRAHVTPRSYGPNLAHFWAWISYKRIYGRGGDHVTTWGFPLLLSTGNPYMLKQCLHIPSYRSGFRSQDSSYVPIVRLHPKIVSSNKGLGGPNSRLQYLMGGPLPNDDPYEPLKISSRYLRMVIIELGFYTCYVYTYTNTYTSTGICIFICMWNVMNKNNILQGEVLYLIHFEVITLL